MFPSLVPQIGLGEDPVFPVHERSSPKQWWNMSQGDIITQIEPLCVMKGPMEVDMIAHCEDHAKGNAINTGFTRIVIGSNLIQVSIIVKRILAVELETGPDNGIVQEGIEANQFYFHVIFHKPGNA